MGTQITIRLSDEQVAFLDEQVSSGLVRSRAELVARSIEHTQRLVAYARDDAVYAERGDYDDLEGLHTWVQANRPADGLDAAGTPAPTHAEQA